MDSSIDSKTDYTGEDDEHKHEAAMADCARKTQSSASVRAIKMASGEEGRTRSKSYMK